MVVDRFSLIRYLLSALLGALLSPLTANTIAIEASHPALGGSLRKPKPQHAASRAEQSAVAIPTRATLVNLHTHELIVLSESTPSQESFAHLLRDRVTGDSVPMAPRLLKLLRELTEKRDPTRIEFISGYRSWKLNEMLRKKGRKVASNSQHCKGHAMDFRFEGMSSKELAQEVENLHWKGGLAYYPEDAGRFVHADVGPNRRWRGR